MTIIISNGDFFPNKSFLLIILLIIILQLRERKVRPLGLIIMPVFMSFIAISLVYNELYSFLNIAIILAGILVGLLIGILIGKFMEVKIDEKDGSMILKGSYIAVAIWIAVILIKIYGENIIGSTGYIGLNLLSSLFIVITVSTMISRRIFLYWKYLNHKKSIDSSKTVL